MKRSEVLAFIEAVKGLREAIDDKQASSFANIYPTLKNSGVLIPMGARINHNGIIMRSRVDLWDTTENDPINAPSLWEAIEYKDGYRNILQTITAENAFYKGEKAWWNNVLYESTLDNNVWTPDQYVAGWNKVSE